MSMLIYKYSRRDNIPVIITMVYELGSVHHTVNKKDIKEIINKERK